MQRMVRLVVVAAVMAMVPIVVLDQAGTVQAAASISFTKQAPTQVLAGKPVPYTLRASNPGDAPLYNVTFRDVLPLGVTYLGPTTPAEFGEPQIITNNVVIPGNAPIAQQTLIWDNVGDLQVGDSLTLDFTVALNATADGTRPDLPVYLVGSTVTNTASVYASELPRVAQRFTSTGAPIPNPSILDQDAGGGPTTLTALEVRKTEPSPEGELLRGVHDFVTTYTLEVEVTGRAAVNGIVAVDLLPASLEFLGCGTDDYSSGDEYPGSGPLGTGPGVVGCVEPTTVDTVIDPVVNGIAYAGLYTVVTWNLGDRAAGSIVTLPYAAGIPLQQNEPFALGTAPTPESGQQGSNLDNNTGASTREGTSESSVTNVATAAGDYQGPLAAGGTPEVTADDSLTRTIEDVRIRKHASRADFRQAAIVNYQITADTSEYTSASDLVLTDQLPNGTCPLGNITPTPPPSEIACGGSAPVPSPLYASVELTPGIGGYTVVFDPIVAIPASGTATATYSAYMRLTYEGGPLDGRSTVSGDTFTNRVTSTATTTPIPNTPESGSLPGVTDASEWTLLTDRLSLDKRLRPRTAARLAPGEPCPSPNSPDPAADTEYINPEDVPLEDRADQLDFRLGDEVCFLIRVDFDDTSRTRNPIVTDFLPSGMEFVDGSATTTAANSVAQDITVVSSGGPIVWLLGTDDPAIPGTDRYAGIGSVFEVVFKARVVDIPDGDNPEVTGNLVKMRTEDSVGRAKSYRDRTELRIVPAPPVSILKGVASVDIPPDGPNGPNVDDRTVRENSVVTYRLDVYNDGNAASSNDYSVRGLDIWDVLPLGITCSQVSNITNFIDDSFGGPVYGVCTNPGDSGQPTFEDRATNSAIRWTFPVDPTDPNGGVDRWGVFDGSSRTLTYQVRIPTPTAAGVTLPNTAYIRSFDAFTNSQDDTASYFPADNVDTLVAPTRWNALAASDGSSVRTPGTNVGKTGVTSIEDLPGNNEPNQAVPGELITYTYSVTIPPATSVFEGALSDLLPAEVTLLSTPAPTARFYADASSPTAGPLPGGFDLGANGTLVFPDTYTNSSVTASQRFEVDVVVRVDNDFSNSPNMVNNASFASNDAVGGAPITTQPATYSVAARHPAPNVQKTANPLIVRGGDLVTYALVASNAAGAAPLYDSWLVDCLPTGLTFDGFGPSSGVTLPPVAGNGSNGCPASTTRIAFALDRIASNTPQTRTYTARVDVTAVGGDAYTNTVRLTGTSLDDGTANADTDDPTTAPDPFERTYSDTDQATVRVPGTTAIKSVSPDIATIGQSVTFTVDVPIPTNTNFFQAAVRDRLPAGLVDPQLVSATCVRLPTPSDPRQTSGCDDLTPPTGAVGPIAGGGGSQLVAFIFGDIVADSAVRNIRIVYTASVADIPTNSAGTVLRNLAQAAWDTIDTPTNPTSPDYPWTNLGLERSADVTVIEPSMTVGKSVSDPTPEPGQLFTYTIALRNAQGANVSDAFDLTVADTIPVGVRVDASSFSVAPATFVQSTDTTPGSITWLPAQIPGPIAAGDTLAITYTARLAPSGSLSITDPPADYTNVVDLTAYRSLPDDGRTYVGGESSAVVGPDFPQLTTVKTALGGQPTYLGSEYAWRIAVTNQGDGTALGVSIGDDLPVNWTYVANSAVVVFPNGDVEQRNPLLTPIGAPTNASWPALGPLEPGQTISIEFRTLPDDPAILTTPGIGSTVRQQNTAQAAAFDRTGLLSNGDGPYGGAPSTASTRIDKVDLRMVKSASTPGPVAGRNFDWFLDVSNLSTTDTGVGPFTVTDTLPTGTTFVSATGTGWTCSLTPPSTVGCTRPGTIAPNGTLPRITVRVRAPRGDGEWHGVDQHGNRGWSDVRDRAGEQHLDGDSDGRDASGPAGGEGSRHDHGRVAAHLHAGRDQPRPIDFAFADHGRRHAAHECHVHRVRRPRSALDMCAHRNGARWDRHVHARRRPRPGRGADDLAVRRRAPERRSGRRHRQHRRRLGDDHRPRFRQQHVHQYRQARHVGGPRAREDTPG